MGIIAGAGAVVIIAVIVVVAAVTAVIAGVKDSLKEDGEMQVKHSPENMTKNFFIFYLISLSNCAIISNREEKRGMAQFGQSASFGTMRPQVRILSRRFQGFKSECRQTLAGAAPKAVFLLWEFFFTYWNRTISNSPKGNATAFPFFTKTPSSLP